MFVIKQDENKLAKIFNSFISVFLLSWAGSYTYEALKISDKTDNIFQFIVNLPITFHDVVISQSVGTFDQTSTYLIFFIISVSVLYFFYKPFLLKLRKEKVTKITSLTDILRIVNIGLMMSIIFFSYYNLTIQNTVVIKPNTNLEIIRPIIDESEYLELRSEYLQVDSSKSLKNFNKKIDKIAKKNNLKTK